MFAKYTYLCKNKITEFRKIKGKKLQKKVLKRKSN